MRSYLNAFLPITILLSMTCSAAETPSNHSTFIKLPVTRVSDGRWKATTNGKEILLQDTRISKGTPEVWDGDFQIRDLKTGRLCSVNADMIGEVYARRGGNIIIAVTEVGAGDYFQFIDIDTCEMKYPDIHGYSKRPHIKNNTIVSGPVCEELEPGKAFCSSANVYILDAESRPILSEKESIERTIQVLGVGFTGKRLVENPRTKQAKLLPEEKKEGWFSAIKRWFSP